MNLKTSKLLTPALGAGALGFFLRLTLYRVGFDEKNILSGSHPLHLACLVLMVGLGVYLVPAVRKSIDRDSHGAAYPLRALGCFAAGCLVAFHGITLAKEIPTLLDLVRAVLVLGAACAMVLCALVPENLKNLHNICCGLICAFFALDMLCRYRGWSGNPQLPDYVFQVFACVLLSLTSYHRLAAGVDLGRGKILLWCSHMALFLSLLCAAGPETRSFYLGGALWAAVCTVSAESPANIQKEDQP